MQKIIKKNRKKGFTLVELLIVIIIIGILAGMMMLSTGAATDKAEATKILSNMRNIKAATIMMYSDNDNKWPSDDIKAIGDTIDTTPNSIEKYLDSKPTGATYSVTFPKADTTGIKATIKAEKIDKNIAEKLTGLESSGVTVSDTTASMNIK
ncbi:MAG: prepilin-type N-terminal cleavage/methylation domain-containing protein [Cloacibacillus sp.]